MRTYVSLFSSAGVGDYGFFEAGFNLIASNELIERRMKVQIENNVANDIDAYITGDINDETVKEKIYKNIDKKINKNGKKSVDLLVATPPCQGISVANHHKNDDDLKRNSLVLQSIIIANKIKPKVIVFENVKRFMKTACTDTDGSVKSIKDVIFNHLESDYNISFAEINFKDYGANSSRPRTLVICSLKKFFGDDFDASTFMPSKQEEKKLKDVIGHLPNLNEMGEIDPNDILHGFKKYRSDMRKWIHNLKPGESAFDNKSPELIPHHMVNGVMVKNKQKNGDKYKRQEWNKVAPAVHTRNDILASQNTVHPVDDRVFSIRELMLMMNVPSRFKWSEESYEDLNKMSINDKKIWLKNNEITIRQSLGEAVPPIIFRQIGIKVMKELNKHE